MVEQNTDYQKTLNLPTTEFPMKAQLSAREPGLLEFWNKLNLYEKMQKNSAGRPKFILHDGPPYANGHIHIGHAVNKILKDIIIKSKTLSGYVCPYVPGWDCHGLPIELNVEKQIGKAGQQVTPWVFREACRQYAQEQIEIQRQEFIRLGIFGAWYQPYQTMDFQYEANIVRTLARIIANGHVEQGKKPVHWCIECGSALAEAEVEYANKNSPAIDVAFPVTDVASLLKTFGLTVIDNHDAALDTAVVIWTTTPWTLPGNAAVAVNAEFQYALVQHHSPHGIVRVVIASDLVNDCTARYGWDQYEVLGHCPGHALAGTTLKHPFYEKQVPIVLGEHVTLESGTGAVHTAPAHGPDDYAVGRANQLTYENYISPSGVFIAETSIFGGLFITKANDAIIEVLKEKHHLLHLETLDHSYPHCWRHKKPLIFMATSQWFISMTTKDLRAHALNAIKTVNWQPEWGEARLTAMIEQRPDWCISRQRTWGTPLALFIHQRDQSLHPKTVQLLDCIANAIEQHGMEVWYQINTEQTNSSLPENIRAAVNTLRKELKSIAGEQLFNDYVTVMDNLDVWFDSGSSHACVLAINPQLRVPADLYLEGSDQHRGWFHTSLLTSVAFSGQAPYRQVVTHGFTVDEQGRKMSKSLGNVIAPEKVIKTLGADILRLWIAATDYRGEIAVSDQILQRIADIYRRMRNTARFLLANLADFNHLQHQVPLDKMIALDRFIVIKAAQVQKEIIELYNQYQFHLIYQKIHQFCSIDLGSFYLDIIKDRLYTTPENSFARRSAQSALYQIIHGLCRWLAPITSFTAEEIWQHIPAKAADSVFLTQWFEPLQKLAAAKPTADSIDWEKIITLRNAVNKEIEQLRNQNKLGAGLEAEITIYAQENWQNILNAVQPELHFILITSKTSVKPLEQAGTTSVSEIPGVAIAIQASTNSKCIRCWHRTPEVGTHKEHPQLCTRCLNNIAGVAEQRFFA